MAIVGNGFDISVLLKYGKGVTTKYSRFYSFFKYKYPEKNNILIDQMERLQQEEPQDENWSDLEAVLARQISAIEKDDEDNIDKLNKDLLEIQQAFSRFLNDVVDNDIIEKVSMLESPSKEKKGSYGYRSMSEFIGDLSKEQYQKFRFHNVVQNYDKILFTFVNLNYTALLDNYVHLDKEIFDPVPYNCSSNNFEFFTNPNDYPGHTVFTNPYCHLLSNVLHPHGDQNIPKSLLFGTEIDLPKNDNHDLRKKFVKSIWARSEELYGKYFKNTNVFIIYGCSLGSSDKWWWKKIYNRISVENGAELLIYHYGYEAEDVVIQRFFDGCGLSEEERKSISVAQNNIYVIRFNKSNCEKVKFLQLPR